MVKEVKKPNPVTIPKEGESTETPTVKKTPSKPRSRKKKPAKKPDISVNAKDLNPILMGAFSLIGSKFGTHWNISEEEATAVTQPLVKVLEKMDLLEKVSNISDGAMLVVGCGSIIIPRLLVQQEIIKGKRVEVLQGGRKKENINAASNTDVATDKSADTIEHDKTIVGAKIKQLV